MMTVTFDLAPKAEAWLREQAARRGRQVPDYLRDMIEVEALLAAHEPLTADEFERLSDELADTVGPEIPPLSDEAMSRESMYGGRD